MATRRYSEFCILNSVLLCLALAAALSVSALWMGLFVDDYFHVAIIEKLIPFGSAWSLFDFAPGNPDVLWPRVCSGPLPWFTLPEMKATFFRPLSSLLAVADHAVFGRHFVWWHLHSMLWYLLLVSAWGLILRKTVPGAIGALALLIFTIDEAHWFPVAWLANRNALVATAPALWGLYAHIRWREDGWKWGLPLSLVGYVTGLLGGESALGVLAYVAAYEAFAGPGRLSTRVRSLLPAAAIGAVYIVVYKACGYGAFGSGTYIDPIQEPFDYLAIAPSRILTLVAGALIGFPPDLSVFVEWLRPIQAVAGLGALLLFAALLRMAWPVLDAPQRRALTWMIPGALLSLLPVAATFPSSRLLLAASLGASVVLASVLNYWWTHRGQSLARRLFAAFGWFLVVAHLIAPPIVWVAQSAVVTVFGKKVVQTCLKAEMGDPVSTSGRHYILLAGPDPLTSIYTPLIRVVEEKRPFPTDDSWQTISMAPCAHRLTRTHANRLEIEVIGGSMLGTEFERLFRSPHYPFRPGQQVSTGVLARPGVQARLGYMTITILEMGDPGPSRVALEFDHPLEDNSSLWFLIWKDGHLRRFQPPPVGATMVLPRERGLL